jgi:hypothetical protein
MKSHRHAATLRRRRLLDSTSSSEERVLELTPGSTLVTVFFLLAVGAMLATAYIVMNSAENCMLGDYRAALSRNDKQQLAQGPDYLRSGGSWIATPIVTTPDNFPPTCTATQVENIKKQLKPEGCFGGRPWTEPCSFTQATKGCQDPIWMTQVYAQQSFSDDKPFVAIHVGWPKGMEKADLFVVDLQLGTKKPFKYDANKVLSQYGNPENPCSATTPAFSGTAVSSTKVYVLESAVDKINDLRTIQKEFNADHDLIIETRDFATKSASGNLDAWVRERLSSSDDPIHHLSINVEGWDFEILMGASNMLNRVRYVDFEVQWKSEWNKGSLSILIRKLKTRGFVCYFSGSNGNLWRITDCWMNHYGEKHWGRIACVNVHHPDVRGILDRMETGFIETLTRTISYGH